MSLLSTVMNHAADLAHSESFFSKNISSRLLTLTLCPPLEAMELIKNTIKLPFQACLLAVKIPTKTINLAISSATLREFEIKLSGPLDLIRTALKIAGLTFGFFFTLTIGILSPTANFKLHYTLGIVRNEKVERQLEAKRAEEKKKKEAYERMLEEQIKRVTDALRLKIMEAVPPPVETPIVTLPVDITPSDESEVIAEENPIPEPIAESGDEIAKEVIAESVVTEDVESESNTIESIETNEVLSQPAA